MTMYLTGQLLIATPHIDDERFHKKVLLICGHDRFGAMGITLNKMLTELTLRDLLAELNIVSSEHLHDTPVYWGGPLETGRGFIIHSNDVILKSSIKISDDFYLSISIEMLDLIAQGKGPQHKIIFLGYAAWSSQQLDHELTLNVWLNHQATPDLIFQQNQPKLWENIYSEMHIDPDQIVRNVGHA